jgi:N-dimethylarginine dimethylaminohydrolase
LKKTVDAHRARQQWHTMARALSAKGAEVLVIAPDEHLTGLVYPANAGFLYPMEGCPSAQKTFHLSNLLPTRAGECAVYRSFIQSLGFATSEVQTRFEGEADFFPAGDEMIFTHGRVERQRFVPAWALPPWKRVYGFRSDERTLDAVQQIARDRLILSLELCLEAHYHGDTVLCSYGPRREYVLAYMGGLTEDSQQRLRKNFGARLLELSDHDAALYAANSFQIENEGRFSLFMPFGVSEELCTRIRADGVEPTLVDVSEFLAKGGGSIKCMILDLGPSDEISSNPAALSFRAGRRYDQIFPEHS